VLGAFHGVLLTDGYGVYGSRARAIGFVQAHDWCHARRRFIDAESTAPETAKVILDHIGALFVIEREIVDEFTGMNLDDALALRRRRRQERSKPIVEEIGRIATEVRALSDSPIARAAHSGDADRPSRRMPITRSGHADHLRHRSGATCGVARPICPCDLLPP